jgi:hypothetical protein
MYPLFTLVPQPLDTPVESFRQQTAKQRALADDKNRPK